MKRKLIFLNSHPIQYFAPMYQAIAEEETFDLEVWYCSRHGLDGEVDKQFGQAVKWDIPILEGYSHRFLKNVAFKPSIYGFWGLINLQVISLLLQMPRKTVVVVAGWSNITCLITIFFAKFTGKTVCLRCDPPLHKALLLSPIKRAAKSLLLGKVLFRLIDFFLYIGTQNKAFYQHYGVKPEQMIATPFAVDNTRFGHEASRLASTEEIRKQKDKLGIQPQSKVVLFTGKLYDVKRPFDLLQAFHRLNNKNLILLFVGDGELRPDLEQYVISHKIHNVVFTGFINQSEIPIYYALSDVIVLCSESEAWGLSINEALNFGLPAVVSDMVGCAGDLVQEGVNGYIFPKGDLNKLTDALNKVLYLAPKDYTEMSRASQRIIQNYSYQASINALKTQFTAA